MFPAYSSREVTIGQTRKIGIHFIIYPSLHVHAIRSRATGVSHRETRICKSSFL